jgi:Protein of unknown function (DUF4058)
MLLGHTEEVSMPLRDHFRPPVSARHSWEGFFGGWPAVLVQRLFLTLPDEYFAEPRVNLGTYIEIDVAKLQDDTPPKPGELGKQYEYEVLLYDQTRDRQLVAAVEFVSPANKDRSEHRQLFVAKCAALLQKNVCVSIVDLVTVRRFNLYAELLELIGRSDPTLGANPPATYAVTCRTRTVAHKPRLENWAYPLEVGRPLPTLPLWLDEEVVVALDAVAG